MAKKTSTAAAASDAGGESRSTKRQERPARVPKKLTAELAIARVCGVGASVARKYNAKLRDSDRATIVAQYGQAGGHETIRRLVLAAEQPQEPTTDEPGDDGNSA